ncbi:MAG: cysteine--tRNA ligase, partial [Lachnospiraceae bacterium]|nr:cysteine--tRNA ligase [Lachnospiraceae bacterium]
LVASFDEVLSLDLLEGAKKLAQDDGVDAETEAWILERIEARKAAKKAKDFAQADAIREELKEKGIAIEDTREGTKWKKM